jgi:hypothetical protein
MRNAKIISDARLTRLSVKTEKLIKKVRMDAQEPTKHSTTTTVEKSRYNPLVGIIRYSSLDFHRKIKIAELYARRIEATVRIRIKN